MERGSRPKLDLAGMLDAPRTRRMVGRAALFALLVAIVVAVVTICGFGYSAWAFAVVVALVGAVVALANCWTIRLGGQVFQIWRVLISLLVAFAVSYAAASWVFRSDIEALTGPGTQEQWRKDQAEWTRQRGALEKVLRETTIPAIDTDPEVVRSHADVTRSSVDTGHAADVAAAARRSLCQGEGSGPTPFCEQQADVYKSEEDNRARSADSMLRAQTNLTVAVVNAVDKARTAAVTRAVAKADLDAVNARLAGHGEHEPPRLNWLDAREVVGDRNPVGVIVVIFVVIAAFVLLDCVAFDRVLRRLRARDPDQQEGLSA